MPAPVEGAAAHPGGAQKRRRLASEGDTRGAKAKRSHVGDSPPKAGGSKLSKKSKIIARQAKKERLKKREAAAAAPSPKKSRAVDHLKGRQLSANWNVVKGSVAAPRKSKPRATGSRSGKLEPEPSKGSREKANPYFDDDSSSDDERDNSEQGRTARGGRARRGQKAAVEAMGLKKATSKNLITGHMEGPTKHVGLDCEMVGVGPKGCDSALARVCLVNSHGNVVLDKMVAPKEKIVDYRTFVSGIRPEMMKEAEPFEAVQKEVGRILKGRILVGHALKNDLKALVLSHPQKDIRDTAKYKPFRKISKGRTPALKTLIAHHFELEIQTGEHSPAEDAQAAMLLFKKFKTQWEKSQRRGIAVVEDDVPQRGTPPMTPTTR